MSPEDIFAAQMWPWPEPALKRDSMGRVLFVNAAFLQMYGGQIDDWRGNIVTGWPAPQPPGMPYRFDTRLPSDDGEQVYDWMEFTMADGNAFAMARNVTYLFQTPDPDPGVLEDVTQADSASPITESAPQAETAHGAQEAAQSVLEVPAVESYAEESQAMMESISADIYADPTFDSASYDNLTEQNPEQVAEVPVAETPQVPAATEVNIAETPEVPQQEAFQEERSYERRALPLENKSAVLGNNWRDAVIAKAVGAETPKEEESVPTPEVAESVTSAVESGDAPIRILLAEDNAINALLTRTLLEADGHTVETVEDGLLAVEAMKSSKYDLIFMDMRMPNMDGLEATRKIRSMSNVSKSLPIIALTANAFDDDRNACFDSGMNDFMTKPVSAEELSEMVRTWAKNNGEQVAAA